MKPNSRRKRNLSQEASKTIRKTTFKERNHGLSRSEHVIAEAPIEQIVHEFNLIKQKKSKLSRHLRDVVELKVQFYIEEGKIKVNQKNEVLKVASK